MNSRRWVVAALTLGFCIAVSRPALAQKKAATKAKKQADSGKKLDAKINELIRKLGARSYASRERAKAALERLGLLAFDALNAAQHNSDIEVAMRARYLVRRLQVAWSQDTDSAEVKRILKGYSSLSESLRKSRMDRLAGLKQRAGTLVLCRLARFETNDRLSKSAALMILNQDADEKGAERTKLADKIRMAMGRSKRPAADWIRKYADWLEKGKASLADWEKIAKAERQVLARYPERSSRLIARDLYRWLAGALTEAKEEKRAIAMMRHTIQLLDGTQPQLIEIIDWMMERKAWSLIDEVAQRYMDRIKSNRDLLYRFAESHKRRGASAKADELALQAAQLPGRAYEHLRIAYDPLQERGLFKWAEREYRKVIEISKPASRDDQRGRYFLSEMLHDMKREKEAADTLLPVATAIQKDKRVKQVAVSLGRHPGLISRMHFFYSLHYKSKNNAAKQIEHFKKGIIDDPKDPDLLIAMYRFKGGDPKLRKQTLDLIKKAAGHFRKLVRTYEEEYEETPGPGPEQSTVIRDLALNNNQYAWLVSNTTGDYKDAIRCSHRSLELRPKTPGYLDTLGRCYYAVKDYKNAIKYQSQAVKLDPHSLAISRQLALFKKEQKEQQAKQKK